MTDWPFRNVRGQHLSTTELRSGEYVALGILEIISIPDISILRGSFSSDAEVYLGYRQGIAALLAEVHQSSRFSSNTGGALQDTSLEILWLTQEAKNQPFKAHIRLFLVLRAIGASEQAAQTVVEDLIRDCSATLDMQKYEYAAVSYEELLSLISEVKVGSVKAIVKEERLEVLRNNMIPSCYSYDRFAKGTDFSRTVNTLINNPNCVVSFQLMPSAFSSAETDIIESTAQALSTLSRGVAERGTGNISVALAEKHAETYRYYSDHKNGALFRYNVLVFSSEQVASAVSSRIYGDLTVGDQSTGLKTLVLDKRRVDLQNNFYPLPWAASEAIESLDRIDLAGQSGYERLPYIITAEEASEFFRLPIANESVAAGLLVNEAGRASKTYAENIVNASDIEVGRLRSSPQDSTIGLLLNDLTRHMLIVGTPGSGKTTFSIGMLDRLWKQHGIPFLVIEPAKNEYRALVQSIPDLQVFTPGKDHISPFALNPFLPPTNVRLQTYKSTLKTAFAAAVSMSTPLDRIFESSINNCYSDFLWLDSYTKDDKGRCFNISDFTSCFQRTFDEIGYTGDARNIGRAGIVRLQSMASLFDCYHSIPIEDLLQKPTVIELSAVENADQKALIMALLLLSILAYVNSNYSGKSGLRNVILIEEAHVLLDGPASMGQGEADPSAIAQGLIKRMLAEIRSYGVGIVIADQSPRKVTSDVVALTDIKLAFRIVEALDRQIIADSTSMTDTQAGRLSRLKPGEAFLFFGRLDQPEEIRTEDYRQQNNIDITLSDEEIRSLPSYWAGRQKLLRPYPECDYTVYCKENCNLERRRLAREVSRRVFRKFIRSGSRSIETIQPVFNRISELCNAELNGEPFSREILSCTKIHLWRRIRFDTSIPVHPETIKRSLERP